MSSPAVREIERLQYELDQAVIETMTLRRVLQDVHKILGPSAPTCEGCSTEIDEALKIIKGVL